MRALYASALVSMAMLLSCGRQQTVKAKIFERKQVEENRIKIHYEYTLNNKIYRDSETIRNFIIKGDSINVIIDPEKPGKGVPDFAN